MLNKPKNHPAPPRRFGVRVAWISIAAMILLIAARGWIVWHVLADIAPCPACMGATAMQQDCALLGLFLFLTAGAFLFRHYLLQLPFLLLSVALLTVMGIDALLLLNMTQRLYLFDALKFGKEIGAIVQFTSVFLVSTAHKFIALGAVFVIALLFCMFAPRPKRRGVSLGLVLAGGACIAFGSWRPFTMSYVNYFVLQNVLAANVDAGVDKPYTPAFAEQVKRDLLPRTPICVDRAGATMPRPNVLFVLVESLSMHHSQLFGGMRDLTPHLDSIARQYTYIPDFYANGFTTDGGMISVIAGRPPIPAVGRYQSIEAFKGFDKPATALPETLHKAGYEVDFFTTGDLGFLGQQQWLRDLRFDHVEDAQSPFYAGMKRWTFNAAEDKELYARFLQWLDRRSDDKPWFSMLVTLSTHPPFVNPETGKPDEPGVFRYADEQIGVLFDELDKRHFFDNGILLISGDHRSMTPLFAAEQAKFGDSAMGRVPMVIATKLPIQHGALKETFQQTDVLPSLDNLVNAHACRTEEQGLFLTQPPVPPKYVLRARGDKRDWLDVYFTDPNGVTEEGNIFLDGDDSRWSGAKPADWQQIMLRVANDRIERGGDAENALDFVIDLYFPQKAAPSTSKSQ